MSQSPTFDKVKEAFESYITFLKRSIIIKVFLARGQFPYRDHWLVKTGDWVIRRFAGVPLRSTLSEVHLLLQAEFGREIDIWVQEADQLDYTTFKCVSDIPERYIPADSEVVQQD